MNMWQELVRDFCWKIGAATGPTAPEIRDANLRARLIAEEASETIVALVGGAQAGIILNERASWAFSKPDLTDVTEAVDGLCDLIYVALGTAEAIGVNLDPHFKEVHDSNMKKTSDVIDEHGKRGLKPQGWKKPDIAGILAVQREGRMQ